MRMLGEVSAVPDNVTGAGEPACLYWIDADELQIGGLVSTPSCAARCVPYLCSSRC